MQSSDLDQPFNNPCWNQTYTAIKWFGSTLEMRFLFASYQQVNPGHRTFHLFEKESCLGGPVGNMCLQWLKVEGRTVDMGNCSVMLNLACTSRLKDFGSTSHFVQHGYVGIPSWNYRRPRSSWMWLLVPVVLEPMHHRVHFRVSWPIRFVSFAVFPSTKDTTQTSGSFTLRAPSVASWHPVVSRHEEWCQDFEHHLQGLSMRREVSWSHAEVGGSEHKTLQ